MNRLLNEGVDENSYIRPKRKNLLLHGRNHKIFGSVGRIFFFFNLLALLTGVICLLHWYMLT